MPLASTAIAAELVRVPAYPKFGLTPGHCEELLADYMPWVRVVRIPVPRPPCRDPFDTPFLQVAVAGNAWALVSGDRGLLALAGAAGICPIMTVDAFGLQYLG